MYRVTHVRKFKFKNDPNVEKKYKCEVGYSGHEVSVGPSTFAIALGANYVERHITLDRTM